MLHGSSDLRRQHPSSMSIGSLVARRDDTNHRHRPRLPVLVLSFLFLCSCCTVPSWLTSIGSNNNFPILVVRAWVLNDNRRKQMRLTHLARNPLFTTSTPIHLHNDDDHTNDDDNYVVEDRNYDTTIVSPYRRAFMKQTIDHAISISAATLTIDSVLRPNPVLAYSSSSSSSSSIIISTATTAPQTETPPMTAITTDIAPATMGRQPSVPMTRMNTNSAVLCDSTISVWTFGGDTSSSSSNSCTVYLLGTAHISDVSASLAGTLVRQVHPDAVFVELDVKRIQNLPTMPTISAEPSSSSSSLSSSYSNENIESTSRPAILVPLVTPSISSDSSISTASSTESPPPPTTTTTTNGSSPSGNKNWFQRRLLNLAGAAVGKGISSMYSNLSSSGFQPGEEFAEAIRTGREVGATIVLGDQDVQITLRRLAEALSMTDLNQLLNPDSQLEQTMTNLLPSLPPSMDGSSDKNSNTDPTQFKRELSDYVEQMKSRDTVRTIIQELNTMAPEVVRVMLTERDAYMANGLHTLRQSYPKVVAVMGLAHIDGVERNLQRLGWKPVQLSCPK